jgi:endonuclease/exonuclease/phosphatase family metal-dependent hydrolase
MNNRKLQRLVRAALVLCLAISPIAVTGQNLQAVGSDRPVTVMSRNMFIGTDLSPVLGATSFDEFLVAVANAYLNVQQSNIPERAAAVADEIQTKNPDLIGLQEVSLWRTGPFGGPATTVTYDALQSLLDELAVRGLQYTPVAILDEFQAEAPSALGINIGFTDRDVLLARSDLATSGLKLSNIQAQHFATNFAFTSPILGQLTVPRGWISIDGKVRGKQFRFVNVHLESFHPGVQAAQASELILGPANTSLPVMIAGDFNTDSASGDPALNAGYQIIAGAGFLDAWSVSHPADAGFTWPLHLEDPFTSVAPFQRLDLVLTRGELEVLSIELFGHTSADRTPSGLWPSDHAGVVSSINLKPSMAKFGVTIWNETVLSSSRYSQALVQ